MKCILGKLGQNYSFKKKSDSQHENPVSTGPSINEVMETTVVSENDPATKSPAGNVVDEDGLMELFDQFSILTSPMLD